MKGEAEEGSSKLVVGWGALNVDLIFEVNEGVKTGVRSKISGCLVRALWPLRLGRRFPERKRPSNGFWRGFAKSAD